MRSVTPFVVLALLFCLVVAPAQARRGARRPAAATPAGMVLVPVAALDRFVEDVSEEMHSAYGKFVAGRVPEAVEDLATVEAYLTLERARAGKEHVKDFDEILEAARRLGRGMLRAPMPSSDDLEAFFAEAEFVLALHHEAKSVGFQKAGLGVQADLAHLASVTHLLQCIAWADVKLDAGELDALRKHRGAGQKSLDRLGRLPRRFASGLRGFGRTLSSVGRKCRRKLRLAPGASREDEKD